MNEGRPGFIARPTKRGGTRQFRYEFNKGLKKINADELDAEFNNLIGAWNAAAIGTLISEGAIEVITGGIGGLIAAGTITDYNIASISWSKITGVPSGPSALPPGGPAGGALTGTYPNPGINPAAITGINYSAIVGGPTSLPPSGPAGGALIGSYPNPGIDYNQVTNKPVIPTALPPIGPAGGALVGSYPNPGLADNSIGFSPLIPGVATHFILAEGVPLTNLTNPGQEVFLAEMDWTGRGGYFLVLASLHGVIGSDGTSPAPGLHCLIWTGGNPGVSDGTIVGGNGITSILTTSGISFFPFTLTTCQTARAPAGPARVKISASLLNRLVGECQIQDGWLMVAEFA